MTHALPYNAVLALVEFAMLALAIRARRGVFAVAWMQIVFAFVLAAVFGDGLFGSMGLFAYGVFIHTPLVFIVAGFALRQSARSLFVASILLASVDIGVGIDAFLIEPHALQISKQTLDSGKLDKSLRIVLLADLQMREFGDYERAALQTALDQRPDLILLAGDYVQIADANERSRVRAAMSEYLQSIQFTAPLGVYAVPGNVDAPGWEEIFAHTGVSTFSHSSSIESGNILITGLTLRDSFDTQLRVPANNRFQIVLGHGPDFALGSIDADLLVAGHTHGGQVVLPGVGPLLTMSKIPRSWASGRTELGNGRTLIVSRGIGMERGNAPPLRFLCKPEIVVIDVLPRGSG